MKSEEAVYEAFQPLLAKSRPEDALEALRRVSLAVPEFARAQNDLGVLCFRRGDMAAARDHYERAVALAPRDIVLLKNLADYYYVEENRVEEALRLYVRVLEIDPRDVETLTVTGHICVSVRKFSDAKTFYGRVLELEPWNTEVRANLAKLNEIFSSPEPVRPPRELYAEAQRLAAEGQGAAAIEALGRLLAIDPQHALAHNDLGVLCCQAGDPARALEHYEAAVRLEPENVTFKKNLADYYFVIQKRVEEALRLYVAVLERNPQDLEALLATARVCEALECPGDAEVFYRRVLEIEPWNAAAAAGLEQRPRLAAGSAAATPRDPWAMHTEACRLAAAGDDAKADALLDRLVTAYPDFALGWNDRGVLAGRRGDDPTALKCYERAVALAPDQLTYKKNLADLCWVKLGRIRDALGHYVDILAVQPEDVDTLVAVGRICQAMNQLDDARHFFDRVLDIEPWNAAARQYLGELQGASRAAA